MTGVTGLPTNMNITPTVGGDPSPPQEARRPVAEREPGYEAPAKATHAGAADREGLEKMVKDANQSLSAMTSLHIKLDRDNNRMVVQVMDKDNDNKVIRQIPSENVLELSKRIEALKELKGFFLDAKA